MLMPEFEYVAPETLAEACAVLGQWGGRAKVLAGGSDLIVKMKSGLMSPDCLVSLKRLHELKGIRHEAGVGVIIGARVTHNELVTSPIMGLWFPSIPDAAGHMAGYQIRNVGTVGGNLANAVPSADLPPILLALNAKVKLVGVSGARTIALEEFFVGPGKTVLAVGEILTEVIIPEQEITGSHYLKFGLRKADALAVVGIATAVKMQGDILQDVRIALGAVAPVPLRARAAEDALRGKPATEANFAIAGKLAAEIAKPISDIRGSAEYRKHLVDVLTRDSLRSAIEKGKA